MDSSHIAVWLSRGAGCVKHFKFRLYRKFGPTALSDINCKQNSFFRWTLLKDSVVFLIT